MNILLVNNCPPDSGIGVYTLSLHAAIKKLDSGIDLFTLEAQLVNRIYRKISIHVWSAPFAWMLSVLTNFNFMWNIPREYALYHITSPSLGIAARRIKPSILTIHDFMPFTSPRFSADLLLRKSMEDLTKAQRLICVSNYTKEELLRLFNVDPNIVRVVHNGLDHDQFMPRDKVNSRKMLGLSDDKVVVLHVGSEEPRKNLPVLFKAFHQFQKRHPESLLIRIGTTSPATRSLVDSLGIADKIQYYNNVNNPELFYNAADLFIFPSTLEGFGFPPLEAMASGCPVIASNSTSIPEVVGDAGILLDPQDVEGFAEWMFKVYNDEAIRDPLIEKGFKRSEAFSWDICARETYAVYQEILS
ncbi:glycosyltransferase family 4 protein [Chloroflexota bacterium]